ncbi:MAG: hypothetical protein M3Q44_08165 [bacterium]|nr:hypothetical protein [bacterium]
MSSSIIITTAPTGLGHIRVTNALLAGLPKGTSAHVLGIQDESISFTYHLISTNYYLRKVLEFTQTNTTAEKIVTPILNYIQTRKINDTVKDIEKIIEADKPDKLVIVSTHAFIAQKIARIVRHKLVNIPIYHAVIVTDDSPQRFWMVDADNIFVPSTQTKSKLEELFREESRQLPSIEVVPYPINPKYCQLLDPSILYNKTEQLTPENPQKARICIPVSGAAVQLDFYKTLIDELTSEEIKKESREFKFSVVTKEGNYTKPFIDYLRNNSEVVFHIGVNDFQTVQIYDRLYEQLNPPALEITKPSEQCFKVLTTPDTIGGPILLLTEPVGRQEYDNLAYLKRFKFLPDDETHQRLFYTLCHENQQLNLNEYPQANTWRALCLPIDPIEATRFIINGLKSGLFLAMQNYKKHAESVEISPSGVVRIWEKVLRN